MTDCGFYILFSGSGIFLCLNYVNIIGEMQGRLLEDGYW